MSERTVLKYWTNAKGERIDLLSAPNPPPSLASLAKKALANILLSYVKKSCYPNHFETPPQ